MVTNTMENIENNKVKLTITVSADKFRDGLQKTYNKNKHHFNLPGFRKGKAPRKMVEQMYGRDVFYEDTINDILPDAYESALDEFKLDPVYRPQIEPGDISEKEGAVFFATVSVRPTPEISDYAGLTYPIGEHTATEEEIEKELQTQLERNSRQVSVNRAAAMNDIVNINFKGFIDGELFDGGEGEDFNLTLGSGQFIPGFEEQLVGASAGDDVKVNVKFPDDYHHEDYKGKEALFEVEILDVQGKELPELDDDFAQDISEFDTLDEYKADLAERIAKSKETNYDVMKRNHILKQLTEKMTVEIPEDMYLGRIDEMMDDFRRQIEMQGMNLESYFRFTQMSPDALRVNMRPQAEIDVKNILALEAVTKNENLTISDEDFATKIGEMLKTEDENERDNFLKAMSEGRKRELTRSILAERALEIVIEKAVAVEGSFPTEETEELFEGDDEA